MKLSPGDKLYGFCNGYFGRDSYADKEVLALGERNGVLWITAVDTEGRVALAFGMEVADVERWKVDEQPEWEL